MRVSAFKLAWINLIAEIALQDCLGEAGTSGLNKALGVAAQAGTHVPAQRAEGEEG